MTIITGRKYFVKLPRGWRERELQILRCVVEIPLNTKLIVKIVKLD
jgi:hypothetical protein